MKAPAVLVDGKPFVPQPVPDSVHRLIEFLFTVPTECFTPKELNKRRIICKSTLDGRLNSTKELEPYTWSPQRGRRYFGTPTALANLQKLIKEAEAERAK